ncbi:hypothetical protein ACPVDA_003281 [Pseudomonas aeruginosa]
MMDARKLLINLLYLATAQSSELPGWSHRETKKSACCAPRIEKVPELEVAQTPTAKKSACCAVRIEEVKDDDVTQSPPATQ